MTIYEATKDGPAFCLMGENQVHHIGRTVYRFDGHGRQAIGYPHIWIDGQFRRSETGVVIYRNWSTKVTVVN